MYKDTRLDVVLSALLKPLEDFLGKKVAGYTEKFENINTTLAALEKGTIKIVDVVNLFDCESGVYLTDKIIYRQPNSLPTTKTISNKSLLIVEKNELVTHFQWVGATYIFEGLSNTDGLFENAFTEYKFSNFATKEYVDGVIGGIDNGYY